MRFPTHNWKPTPTIWISLLLLVICCSVILLVPALWMWMAGILLCNHALLTAAGLWPRSSLLGPNITRLPATAAQQGQIAITIDDGPDPEVTPQVLDILDRYQVKATFFCIGRQAQRYPELCRAIILRGHDVENHSYSHNWYFSLLSPWHIQREVRSAQTLLGYITGRTPRFFRATAGLRNPALEPVLAHCGLRLCSWTRRGYDTRVGDAERVLTSLTSKLHAGDILLLHDGNAARTNDSRPVILQVLPRLLEYLARTGLHCVRLSDAVP